MSVKTKKLKKKYGKLTVVSEETVDSRRTAIVNCSCGVQKRVLVDALTSGRTRSCGSYECKHGHSTVKVDKQYNPSGSREIPLPVLRKIWARHTHPKRPEMISTLAAEFEVKTPSTLYSALRAVRRSGGINEYIRKVMQ